MGITGYMIYIFSLKKKKKGTHQSRKNDNVAPAPLGPKQWVKSGPWPAPSKWAVQAHLAGSEISPAQRPLGRPSVGKFQTKMPPDILLARRQIRNAAAWTNIDPKTLTPTQTHTFATSPTAALKPGLHYKNRSI
jgi:hypothetical protein